MSSYGSVYVPLDSWIYPAFERLFSLGYADSAYLGMRPWTRTSCLQILQETYPKMQDAPQDKDAWKIFQALAQEFGAEAGPRATRAEVLSVYTRNMYIKGRPINDSLHFGQTLINDNGRPYQEGFNALDGFTARAEAHHFTLDVRGEYQHAPGRAAYPDSVAELFSTTDHTPLVTPEAVPQTNVFRLINANLGLEVANHVISVGKVEDEWGPTESGSLALSNNAEPVYALRINRVTPLRVPFFPTCLARCGTKAASVRSKAIAFPMRRGNIRRNSVSSRRATWSSASLAWLSLPEKGMCRSPLDRSGIALPASAT